MSTWTQDQDDVIRARYPSEGASEGLCNDVGRDAWRIRHRAYYLGLRLDAEVVKRKKHAYNAGRYGR